MSLVEIVNHLLNRSPHTPSQSAYSGLQPSCVNPGLTRDQSYAQARAITEMARKEAGRIAEEKSEEATREIEDRIAENADYD